MRGLPLLPGWLGLWFPKKTLAESARVQRGAENVNRTHDLLITNQLLYRLSYPGKACCLTASRPPSN